MVRVLWFFEDVKHGVKSRGPVIIDGCIRCDVANCSWALDLYDEASTAMD